MKDRNLLTKLTFLVTVLLTFGPGKAQADMLPPVTRSVAQAQVPRKFDRIGSLAHESILKQTDSAAQQNQALALSTPQAPPQVRYMVIELGGRRANDISQSGQIVGNKVFGRDQTRRILANSQSAPIDLGSLPGLGSVVESINPRREMVGYAFNDDSSVERPLFWASTNAGPVELSGLPAGLLSEVYGINPSGQIVGQFFSADFSVEEAVLWPNSNAAPVYLPQLSGEFPHGAAQSINPSGNILGDACDADFVECHAVFWTTSTSTPVALASPGGEFIYTDFTLPGHSINGPGNMVGYAHNVDFSAERAVFWASARARR